MATAVSYKGRGAAGAVVTQYNYSPFGETQVMGTDPIGLSQPFRFTGRESDAETGMYYYRARYYSPEMRRFISEDPIRFAGGDVNFYAYVGNNPANFVDPLGLILKLAGSNSDREKILEGLTKLASKSDTALELIRRLIKSSETVTIGITAGGNEYDKNSNMCSYNPNLKSLPGYTDAWATRPAEIGLAHELIHALHDVEGNFSNIKTIEEHRTIGIRPFTSTISENDIRAEYGESLRTRY